MKEKITLRKTRDGRAIVTYRWFGENTDYRDELGRIQITYDVAVPEVGADYIIGTYADAVRIQNVFYVPDNGHGLPGNTSPTRYKYHGWRGSYNDIATRAHGLRRCLSITKINYQKSAMVRIEFGNDMRRGEE